MELTKQEVERILKWMNYKDYDRIEMVKNDSTTSFGCKMDFMIRTGWS